MMETYYPTMAAALLEGGRRWRAALYLRLSVEDGRAGESSSIESQRRVLEAWAASRDDVEPVAEFADDGWSGSNFDRPGFRAMMDAVDAGEVDCILVKDLSRLGRNYIECGRYLERVFPAKGVRLVAVNDGYDGLRAGAAGGSFEQELVVPFKNLVNDWYCAQASAKIGAALAARREAGLFVGAFAPYGYEKDPADRNRLVIDEEAAGAVRLIFEMRAAGEALGAIAAALDEAGAPTPARLKRSRGCRRADGFAAPGAGEPSWHARQVSRILSDEVYKGVLVQGKTFKPSFRHPERYALPASSWCRVEGACPAIVAADLFEAAARASAASSGGRAGANPIRGLAFCGACGGRVRVVNVRGAGGRALSYYRCAAGCGVSARADDVLAAVRREAGGTGRRLVVARVEKVVVGPSAGEVSVRLRPGAGEASR